MQSAVRGSPVPSRAVRIDAGFGQTGSGKTHTMLGNIENGTRRNNENCGKGSKKRKASFTCKMLIPADI